MMKTTIMPNPANIQRKWYVVDADGATLGRLATVVAAILKGKNNVGFNYDYLFR